VTALLFFGCAGPGAVDLIEREGRSARFSAQGLVAQEQQGALQLVTRLDGQILSAPVESAACALGVDCAVAEHAGVHEWWTLDDGQLHHGWTLREPLAGPLRVELLQGHVVGVDRDLRGATFHDSDGQRWRYSGLHAWDAEGTELSAELSLIEGLLQVDVDTTDAVWPVVVDPILVPQGWSILPVVPEGQVLDAGALKQGGPYDVDDDGTLSALVWQAYTLWEYPLTTPFDPEPTRSWHYPDVASLHEKKLRDTPMPIGDCNGDGALEMGLTTLDRHSTVHGATLWVAPGGVDGPGTGGWELVLLPEDLAHGWMRIHRGVSDFNDDGYDDLVLHVFDQVEFPNHSRIWVYYGGPDCYSNDRVFAYDFPYNDTSVFDTEHVYTPGDVTGDGVDDLIIAFVQYDPPYPAQLTLVHGGPAGLSLDNAQALPVGSDPKAGALVGWSIGTLGDLDGDGTATTETRRSTRSPTTPKATTSTRTVMGRTGCERRSRDRTTTTTTTTRPRAAARTAPPTAPCCWSRWCSLAGGVDARIPERAIVARTWSPVCGT
jgi:hypothetical protein